MDLQNGKIKAIYFQYLAAAFGSAMITSVYSIVDMAMVGQYQGPEGTARWRSLRPSGTSSTASACSSALAAASFSA